MRHVLKTWQPHFDNIVSGKKPFDVRKNDRGFKEGDSLILQEYDPKTKTYSGKEWDGTITTVLDDPMFCKKNHVILGLKEKES